MNEILFFFLILWNEFYLSIHSPANDIRASKLITIRSRKFFKDTLIHSHSVYSVQNQLVGAYEGQRISLHCGTEAYPKSINYWTYEKGDIVPQGECTDCRLGKISNFPLNLRSFNRFINELWWQDAVGTSTSLTRLAVVEFRRYHRHTSAYVFITFERDIQRSFKDSIKLIAIICRVPTNNFENALRDVHIVSFFQ